MHHWFDDERSGVWFEHRSMKQPFTDKNHQLWQEDGFQFEFDNIKWDIFKNEEFKYSLNHCKTIVTQIKNINIIHIIAL